jgi:hypothetical protein
MRTGAGRLDGRRNRHGFLARPLEEPGEHLAPVFWRQHLGQMHDASDAKLAVPECVDDLGKFLN